MLPGYWIVKSRVGVKVEGMMAGIRDSRSRADLREVRGSALVDIVAVNVIGVEEDDEGERAREVKDDMHAGHGYMTVWGSSSATG